MKCEQRRLANGLTIVGEVRESAVSVALGFFVKTGARDETPEIAGVSHFLEHMMFKGTPTRSALDINYALAAMGAQANAFTSEENTVFYAAVLPEYFRDALDLLSDMLRPSLDPKEFDVEKKVILEEIALYQDKPHYVVFEAALRQFFTDHPAGNSVLGSLESIGALPVEKMRQYFDRRYVPNNMTLVVAGNFNFDELTERADKLCGAWTSAPCTRDVPQHRTAPTELILRKPHLTRAHVCLVGAGPSATDELRFPSQVLATILGDSQGSRVYWELIDKGLVDNAGIDTDEMDGTGIVLGSASCAVEDVEKVSSVLRTILSTAGEFSNEELERAKTKIRTRLVLQGESSMRRLMSVGLDWLARGEYLALDEEIRIIAALERRDIDELLGRFPFAPSTEVRLLPAEG